MIKVWSPEYLFDGNRYVIHLSTTDTSHVRIRDVPQGHSVLVPKGVTKNKCLTLCLEVLEHGESHCSCEIFVGANGRVNCPDHTQSSTVLMPTTATDHGVTGLFVLIYKRVRLHIKTQVIDLIIRI